MHSLIKSVYGDKQEKTTPIQQQFKSFGQKNNEEFQSDKKVQEYLKQDSVQGHDRNGSENHTSKSNIKKENILQVKELSKGIKKNKTKRIWKPEYKLISVSYPTELDEKKIGDRHYRKRFAVHVKYQDENKKVRQQTVRFGEIGKQELIDHHDPQKSAIALSRIRNFDDPLRGNYYKILLLNQSPNIAESYERLIQYIKQKQKQ